MLHSLRKELPLINKQIISGSKLWLSMLVLAEQFGAGVQMVFLQESRLSVKLISPIEKSWESADRIRPPLLDSAAHPVELSRAAYKLIFEIVTFGRVAR